MPKNPNAKFEITRIFDAPRDLLFKVWTQPEHLTKWSGPKGFSIKYEKSDIRPEGIAHYVMTMPDGGEMWGKVIYKELKFPTRIVYLQYFSDADEGVARHPISPTWPLEMLTTVIFEDEGKNKTKITLTWEPQDASREEIETFNNAKGGMSQGWGGSFENLDNYLKEVRHG